VYFRYVEEAEQEMWRSAGLNLAGSHAGIGWPRVHASMDFHAALRFGDDFTIAIRVAEIGTSSLRYAVALRKGRTPIATGSLVVVCVRRRPGRPMTATPIPAGISSRFRVARGAGSRVSRD